jgi:PPIC-type PPIASE domain
MEWPVDGMRRSSIWYVARHPGQPTSIILLVCIRKAGESGQGETVGAVNFAGKPLGLEEVRASRPSPMSKPLPYFASGLALVLLSVVVALRAKNTNDLTPQCRPEEAARPETPVSSAPKPVAASLPKTEPAPRGLRAFDRMQDGSPVPALPADAPKRVRLGVALFRFAGAEGSTPRDRSREAAESAAAEALKSAQEGFRRAIAKGDPGSNEDIGWIPRGVLEKRVEHAVFSLKAGELGGGPVETPRGFWVVRRIK